MHTCSPVNVPMENDDKLSKCQCPKYERNREKMKIFIILLQLAV